MSHSKRLSKQEAAKMKQWHKGYDFIDGTPRYSFEGRDPQSTYETIQVVIYSQYERKFSHDTKSRKLFYYGYVINSQKETSDTVGRFETLKKAKEETEKLFYSYLTLYPEAI
jgi:hypothetical protein